jgi:polar amino acid transport system permease protein
MGLNFAVLPDYAGLMALGAFWTAVLTIVSGLVSVVVGTVMAVSRMSTRRWVTAPISAFMWLFMGTPLLLQLYFIYFGLVEIGIDLSAFTAGIIALSVHFAVYNADVIRAAIAALDPGQYEGARSVGLTHFKAMRLVVVPQALRNVAPALGNNMIALLKESSLVSIIGVMELTLSAQKAISETYRPFEFYIAAAAIYYVLNMGLEYLLARIEQRTALTR